MAVRFLHLSLASSKCCSWSLLACILLPYSIPLPSKCTITAIRMYGSRNEGQSYMGSGKHRKAHSVLQKPGVCPSFVLSSPCRDIKTLFSATCIV